MRNGRLNWSDARWDSARSKAHEPCWRLASQLAARVPSSLTGALGWEKWTAKGGEIRRYSRHSGLSQTGRPDPHFAGRASMATAQGRCGRSVSGATFFRLHAIVNHPHGNRRRAKSMRCRPHCARPSSCAGRGPRCHRVTPRPSKRKMRIARGCGAKGQTIAVELPARNATIFHPVAIGLSSGGGQANHVASFGVDVAADLQTSSTTRTGQIELTRCCADRGARFSNRPCGIRSANSTVTSCPPLGRACFARGRNARLGRQTPVAICCRRRSRREQAAGSGADWLES